MLAARATKGDGDKSWGEIIEDAAGVAKSVFNKIKDTASSILPSPTNQQQQQKPAQAPPRQEAPIVPGFGGGLLPNLVGRAVGSLLSSAVSSLSAQLEEAARAQAGECQAEGQSSSSSSINGVVTKQVVLLLPVYGSAGASGTAQVSVVEGPSQPGGRTMTITVRTPDGGVVVVDDGPPGGGSVIDVEYRELRK
ncbi:hypothetical protein GPECTOR_56g442 [Gonium pectorale]|uniref:Uncharacterized protein n=1 Tax=Gonium pectorale TaxID=33097 RepID=A0A150G725_GONPE|nr:hypothetical protein GPECTOR_56g442 [Gonium pectorale]|eukprot:KXZ45345.1 hypothetical protein GPECTOR_56g442 [Gonium pectorale]